MADLASLAQTILDLTTVVTDAADAQPGKYVHIDVLPGFNSALLSITSSPLGQVLNTLLNPPTLNVQFDVKKDGVPAGGNASSTPPVTLGVAQALLNVAFLLIPPFGEDTVTTGPAHYEIDVTLTVSINGQVVTIPPAQTQPVSRTITIPVDVPAVQFPSLLLAGKYANFATHDPGGDDPGKLLVMVRASSPLRDLGSIVAALNRVAGLVTTLQTFADFGGDFLPALQLAASLIGAAPVVYFNIGNVHNTDDDGNDFDDDASCLLLIGVTDHTKTIPQPDNHGNVPTVPGVTQVTFFSKGDFNLGLSTTDIDAEHTTFSIENNEEIVISLPGAIKIQTGIGIKRIDDFKNMSWATEQGDSMDDDTNSIRWGGVD